MSPRKKSPSRPISTSRVEATDSKATEIQHYNAILIEELNSNVKLIAEKVMSLDEKFERKLNEGFKKVDQEFADIKAILGSHSEKLNSHSKKLDSHTETLAKHT